MQSQLAACDFRVLSLCALGGSSGHISSSILSSDMLASVSNVEDKDLVSKCLGSWLLLYMQPLIYEFFMADWFHV